MRVSIFGSCITRDVFRLFPDAGEVGSYHSRSSLISVMSSPCGIRPGATEWPSNFARKVVLADLTKTFFDDLEAVSPDALIVDLMSERFDLLRGRRTYVTRSWELVESGLVLPGFERVSRETEAMDQAWRERSREFAAVLQERFPDLPVILHKAYWTSDYRDGSQVRSFPRAWRLAIADRNQVLEAYHAHLEQLLPDLIVVAPRRCYVADAGHRWGLGSSHYEQAYYADVRERLRAVFERSPTTLAA